MTVNFVNADVEAVTRAFAAIINRPIVVDPRVKGQITVYSEQPQSIRDAYASYLSALRGLGFAVVESGGLLKVVPEADAKLQAGTVSVGAVAIRGDQVITQIFPLRYENPNNLVAVLRPLISANNTINANPGSNALVITDYADNLQRIAKIIAALDQPSGTDVEIVPLQHGVASDLAPLVQRLSDGGGVGGVPGVPGSPSAGGVTVVADSRANALIIRAPNAARLSALRATIARLDRPSNLVGSAGGGMWVVHLKNADAARLATVVRAAFSATGAGGSGSGGGGGGLPPVSSPGQGSPAGAIGSQAATAAVTGPGQPSTGGFIQADPATNSLIITAPEPLYRQVRALIDQLDSRRAQVYIESMIVEVNGGDAADFGFQWQGLLGKSGDKFGLVTGTNFNNTGPSIIDINTSAAQGTVNVGQGLNIGLLAVTNGVTSLAAIAKLLQSQAETNIISTPNLITLDNEEAKIVVGENVPFITGQFTNTGGGGATTNPFQTIERKDVGITLRIRPQIGEGGAVRMQIFQEQSSVKSDVAAGTTNAGPSTTKRSIENTVVVDDGAILVLGGLIEDRYVTSRSKVPLLGDIPLLGGLFRSESRERRRTNLMVFLRPVVMRDAESANRFSADRYDQIRGEQKSAQPRPSVVMPINESPVLPPLRPPSAPVTTPPPLNPPPNPQPSHPTTLPPTPDGSPARPQPLP
ncbi:MAG: type II secretion system secretin GspD [Rubrivivax sp.]|nr:type II secretion system secretin GspD [Rubrivivax sp.]